MRHLIRLLEETANVLQGEAKERTKSGSTPPDDLEGLWRRCVTTRPDQAVAFRALRWKDWILLTVLERGKKERSRFKWIESGWITVYFGRAPEPGNSPDRPPEERKKAQRKMREILRLYAFPQSMPNDLFKDQPDSVQPGKVPPMSRYKVMVIDRKTSTKIITEQLAVIMAQLNLADNSVMNFLRRRTPNGDTLSVVIAQFADPDHPGSYGEFVKRLRREAARKAKRQEAASLDHNEFLDPEFMEERVRQGKPVKSSRHHDDHPWGLTAWEVAAQIGIPVSTVYRKINTGKVRAAEDEHGVKRVPPAEVLKIQSKRDE
ncbi:MAG: hypothetical protein FJY85_15580, partial [Deltaproteobacteria bacterium]|nr:hypothetical protein [Deltaproteobacteria bacterium]